MGSLEEKDRPHRNLQDHAHRTSVKKGLERLDRQPATGKSGGPKKGGHGGKFTWAGPTPEEDLEPVVAALDEKDPNYVDDEEEPVTAGGLPVDPLQSDFRIKQPVEKVVVEESPQSKVV